MGTKTKKMNLGEAKVLILCLLSELADHREFESHYKSELEKLFYYIESEHNEKTTLLEKSKYLDMPKSHSTS